MNKELIKGLDSIQVYANQYIYDPVDLRLVTLRIRDIKEQLEQHPQQGWKSVEDALPDHENPVVIIAWCPESGECGGYEHFYEMAEYCDEDEDPKWKVCDCDSVERKVIAWMPLPTAFRGE